MLTVSKLVFVGEPANVKVSAHRTDAAKLVLKSEHPECPVALAKALGVTPGEAWEGNHYFILTVDKAEFLQALGNVGEALTAVLPAPTALAALPAVGQCPECGCEDGMHWAYCPHHPEHKAN